MSASSALKVYTATKDYDYSTLEAPEHALLRNILIRALYDLAPEALHEDRRDAIGWFRKKPSSCLSFEAVTSFANVKYELKLGSKTLKLIQIRVENAEAFDVYWNHCKRLKINPDVEEWKKAHVYKPLNAKRGKTQYSKRLIYDLVPV